ncbi:MAG: SurA N-terminal domain-containing protein [Syntrophaceae bacterium]
MLELMRKHARSWLVKILLGMVIVVFVLYFGSTSWRQRAEAIAIIDGKAVAWADFQREYQNLIDVYRQRYGGSLTDDVLKSLNLKQQAYDNVINQAVILHKAAELNIQVTEEEVKEIILANPVFQRSGVFDERIYNQFLRYKKMTAADFEETQRKLLSMVKLEDIIQNGVKVSDKEVFDLYRLQNERINIQYLGISANSYKGKIVPSREDLEAYLKKHEDAFRVPEQIQIKYISFQGQKFAHAAKVSDAEIAEYYNRHKDSFKGKDGKPAPLSEAKDKIVSELKQVQGMYIAADEAKKAHDVIYQKENYDDYAKQNGLKINSTGLFSAKNIPQEFKQIKDFNSVVFSLQTDEISPVLSDNTTYYLMKLAAKKPSHVPALNEIEKEVGRQFVEGESIRLCKKDAEAILESLKKGETLQKVSQEKGLKTEETGLFLPGSSVPNLGSSREINSALYQISEKNPYPDNVYFVNGSFVIMKFKERGKLDVTDFDTKKAALKNVLLKLKKNEHMQLWVETNKETMKNEGKLKFTKDIKDI